MEAVASNGLVMVSRNRFANMSCFDSDGIARIHGMANVQAEELVE